MRVNKTDNEPPTTEEIKGEANPENTGTVDTEESQKQPDKAHTDEKQVDEKADTPEDTEPRSQIKRTTKADLFAEVHDLKEDMEVLNVQIQDKASEIATLKAEIEKYKTEIQSNKEVAEKYNSMIQEVIQEKKNNIPQEIQELLPDGLTVEQQLAWLTKAQNTGKQLKKEAPVVEIGKPMNMGVPHQDTANMTPHQKMASYFATVFK